MPASAVSKWPPREVSALRYKLDELTDLVRTTASTDSQEVRDWLARVLVVRSCGYLEQVVLESCRGYIHGLSGGPVRSFGRSWLDRGRNPDPAALILLVGRFDAQWANDLMEFFEADDQRLHREISFLVDRRN